MKKKQLIARVRQLMGAGTTQATASAAAEAVLSSILAAAAEGDKVHITRFGTFEYAERPARRVYDINTGQMTETVPARKLTFRPSVGFVPKGATLRKR